jgi:hypothetical protein
MNKLGTHTIGFQQIGIMVLFLFQILCLPPNHLIYTKQCDAYII